MTRNELLSAAMYLAPYTHGDKTLKERAADALALALAVDAAVEEHLAPPAPPAEEPAPPAEEAPEPIATADEPIRLESSIPPTAP